MPDIVPIDDPADPRVADYVGLTDAALRRRVEQPGNGAGIFIAEGLLVIRRLLRSEYKVRSLLVTPGRLDVLAPEIAGLDAPVFVAGPGVMNAVAGFDIHRGALAAADRRPPVDVGSLAAGARRITVLEGINDHENLGGIFRNAAALGMEAVLLSPDCCDPLYRRCVRVSMGTVLGVHHAVLTPWPQGLQGLSELGFRLVALTPHRSAVRLDALALRSLERVALMLGSEAKGLSEAVLRRADVRARVPMAPGVDSLNVASTAAIAFHAACDVD